MQETRVRSLGREDPLEKEMVTHSSILAWRIPWMKKPGRLQSTGVSKESDTTEWLYFHFLLVHSDGSGPTVCFFLLAALCGLQDLSSPTKDWTQARQWKSWVLTTGPPGIPLSVFFFFNWKIIALQCCVGICHTSAWISINTSPLSLECMLMRRIEMKGGKYRGWYQPTEVKRSKGRVLSLKLSGSWIDL